MRNKITEETVPFISIIKWVALATGIGAIVGLSTTGFQKSSEVYSGESKIFLKRVDKFKYMV